jgi:hypothetical protein
VLLRQRVLLTEVTNRQNSDGAGVIFRLGKVPLGRVILQRVLLRSDSYTKKKAIEECQMPIIQ